MGYINSKRFQGVQLYKKANNDITYYIRYKNLDGKLIREKIGNKSAGITEVFCNQKRNDILNKLRLGEDIKTKYHKKKKIKFEDIWFYFVDNKAMENQRRIDLKGIWNKHLKEYFEYDVTIDKLQKFRKAKKNPKNDKKLSARTIDMRISEIGTAFNFWNNTYIDDKIENPIPTLRNIDKDTVTKKEKQSRDIKRDRYLNIEEVNQLKEYVANLDPDIILFVAIALSTGARLSSIMTIQKKDILDNKVVLTNHKTGGGTYTGFLNNNVLELLIDILPSLNLNDSIFKLNKTQIQKRLQRVLNKLFNQGLDTKDSANRVVVHSLRHTFASRLVENGVPIIKVQKLLDHKDIHTTMRYSHLAPDSGIDDVMNMWE